MNLLATHNLYFRQTEAYRISESTRIPRRRTFIADEKRPDLLHDSYLSDLVVMAAAALAVVSIFRRLKLPSLAGFIVVGIALGPSALGWVRDPDHVQHLAEIGVILLLFGIGTELSMSRLKSMWVAVLVGGGLQLALTLGSVALLARVFGFGWPAALATGAVVSVSSTAIVLRELGSRAELSTNQGRFALGILIFQDLAVVPMMLLLDTLSAGEFSGVAAAKTIATSLVFVVFVLVVARIVVPWWINRVALTRERELFILAIFLVCFGVAWLAHSAGLSMAIGAFLAGLAVSESEFRHQALAELLPAREMFVALFFIAIGMSLQLQELAAHLPTVAMLLVGILALKAVIITAVALVVRLPVATAIQAGLILCQVGEFSLIMLEAVPKGFIAFEMHQSLVAAIVLSMVLTPFSMKLAPVVAGRVRPRRGRSENADAALPAHASSRRVLVVGFGLTGRRTVENLQSQGVAVTVIDSNLLNTRLARAKGLSSIAGDARQGYILNEAGIANADLLLVSVNNPEATKAIVQHARHLNPTVKIITRAQYAADEDPLRAAGADIVVVAESAAAERVATLSLELLPDAPRLSV
ncbi:MAG: cation:proton antiporter [Myxococcota bacterium]